MAKHGKRLVNAYEGLDREASLPVDDAVRMLKERATAKFDETVEIAINLDIDPRHADQQVRGVVQLPNGTGKAVRVAVFARGDKAEEAKKAGADVVGAEDLAEKIEATEKELSGSLKAWKRDMLTAEVIADREELGELHEQITNIPRHIELAANFTWGKDLGGSDESIISDHFDRPVAIYRYPLEAKAFYMKRDPTDGRVVLNFDMLAPEGFGEIIGGSQREDNLDALLERMKAESLDPEAYQWYLDLRRFGSVPHGGFGLGLERTVAWLTGTRHIRETIAFPRMVGRLYP